MIFDVGAHIGNKSEQYLQLSPAKLVCVEPQEFCIKKLKRKFHNNPTVQEEEHFKSSSWLSKEELIQMLNSIDDSLLWGDIYAKSF